MTLDEYFQKYGIKQNWFCAQLGISDSAMSQIRRGNTFPEIRRALEIQKFTENKVTWKDIYQHCINKQRLLG